MNNHREIAIAAIFLSCYLPWHLQSPKESTSSPLNSCSMTSPKRFTNRKGNSIVVGPTHKKAKALGDGPTHKKAKALGDGRKRYATKRLSAVRDWPLNFLGASKADMASIPNVDAGTGDVGSKKPLLVAISDDELGSINRAIDPCSTSEYNPITPPSKTLAKPRLPFEDDAFSPGLYRSTGSAVTIGDYAILNPTVARGIMLSSMLPRDRHCYDQMTDIDQALDRAAQYHFTGLSLVRKVGELHYEALVKKQKAHAAASYHLERENERLKCQIEDLHAKGREADNALELMRRQRDRANFKVKGLGDYVAAPPDAEKAVDGVDDEFDDPEEE